MFIFCLNHIKKYTKAYFLNKIVKACSKETNKKTKEKVTSHKLRQPEGQPVFHQKSRTCNLKNVFHESSS